DPIDSPQSACGCIAADTSVHDLKVPARLIDFFLEQRRESVVSVEPESRRDAVAEHENGSCRLPGKRAFRCSAGKACQENQRQRGSSLLTNSFQYVSHGQNTAITNMHLMVVSNFGVSCHV